MIRTLVTFEGLRKLLCAFGSTYQMTRRCYTTLKMRCGVLQFQYHFHCSVRTWTWCCVVQIWTIVMGCHRWVYFQPTYGNAASILWSVIFHDCPLKQQMPITNVQAYYDRNILECFSCHLWRYWPTQNPWLILWLDCMNNL